MLFFNVFPDFTSFFDALFNFLLFFASVSPPSFSVFTLETNVGILVFNFVEASVKVEEFADNLSKLSITVATLPDTFSAPTFKSPVVEVACFIAWIACFCPASTCSNVATVVASAPVAFNFFNSKSVVSYVFSKLTRLVFNDVTPSLTAFAPDFNAVTFCFEPSLSTLPV